MTQKYRLMIYFAHSTMMIYSKKIICRQKMTPEDFYHTNESVMKRVFDEGKSIMNYELSHNQMMKACYVYLSAEFYPQSPSEVEIYSMD